MPTKQDLGNSLGIFSKFQMSIPVLFMWESHWEGRAFLAINVILC